MRVSGWRSSCWRGGGGEDLRLTLSRGGSQLRLYFILGLREGELKSTNVLISHSQHRGEDAYFLESFGEGRVFENQVIFGFGEVRLKGTSAKKESCILTLIDSGG